MKLSASTALSAALASLACGSNASRPDTQPNIADDATEVAGTYAAGEPDATAVSDLPESDEGELEEELVRLVGKFVRFELITRVPDAAVAYYEALLGWRSEPADDDGDSVYTIHNGDRMIGRIRAHDASKQFPEGWMSWISVDDVDDVLRDVEVNGGSVVVATRRVRNERRALVTGPTGGTFGLVRADEGDQPDRRLRHGDWYWSQLWTTDFDEALTFAQIIGGYTSIAYRYGELRYRTLLAGGVARGVIVRVPKGQSSRWLPFVQVDDVRSMFKQAKSLRAKVITEPRDVDGIGLVAVLQAPTGGIFGIIEPVAEDGGLSF